MIENLTIADKYVYHYTKAHIALDHIIKERSLRFGKYINTNDPKETKTWQFDIGTNENRDLGRYNMNALSEWLSRELKLKTKLVCFSTDTDPLTGDHISDIFKRGYCKPRMWAQYADNHTGICLVFARQKLSELIDAQFGTSYLILSGHVSYVDRIIVRKLDEQQYMINLDFLESVGKEAYVRSHLETHYKVLFFEKMSDWRDESEFRWVIFSETEADIYLDYKDSLVGIMFGENTNQTLLRQIMDLTEDWGIRYMGLKWKNCSPWYDYGNLLYIRGVKNSPWSNLIKPGIA
jgi:hypothetical protein